MQNKDLTCGYAGRIAAYIPRNEQEAADQRLILWYIRQFPDTVLTRDNPAAHITSSSLILNPTLDKALMIHHNIRDAWAWTGGHADGDADLLAVAIREAQEETGVEHITPLTDAIASLDSLVVFGHKKRGQYVSAHLHLSVAYILICDEAQPLRVKPDENSGVRWFPVSQIAEPAFSADDVYLYGKLLAFAQDVGGPAQAAP